MVTSKLRVILSRYAGFAVLAISLFTIFLYLECATFTVTPSLPFKIAGALADSCILLPGLFLLRGRWRIVGGFVAFGVMAVVMANVCFLRNFNDLIPYTSYFNSQLGDPTVIDGAINSFRVSDLILIAAGIGPLVYYLCAVRHKATQPWPVRLRAAASAAIILIGAWAVSLAGSFRREANFQGISGISEIAEWVFPDRAVDMKTIYRNLNFTGYAARGLAAAMTDPYIKLSADKEREIASYLDGKTRHSAAVAPIADDSLKRNLIVIMVESLETRALHISSDLHPALTRLIDRPNTVYIDKCRVLTNYGRSSDAQFMVNTGLLPLRDEALVNRYALNDYPSLAKILNSHSVEIIGEDKSLWSHGLTNKSYGFDKLIDNLAPSAMNQDSIIFEASARYLESIPQPFFMFIATLSMHDPYRESKTGVSPADSIFGRFSDDRDKEYFRRLHHCDHHLGLFIEKLKALGLYDDTLIIIVGDHEIREGATSFTEGTTVPLIIVNAPDHLPLNEIDAAGFSQIDIFPTILYLMGRKGRFLGADYTGLGTNLFCKPARPDPSGLPTNRDYDISELIIRRH